MNYSSQPVRRRGVMCSHAWQFTMLESIVGQLFAEAVRNPEIRDVRLARIIVAIQMHSCPQCRDLLMLNLVRSGKCEHDSPALQHQALLCMAKIGICVTQVGTA